MAKVKILRRKNAERKDGLAPLYYIVYITRTKAQIPSGLFVTEKEWDPVKEQVKGRSQEAADKNLILANMKARITDVFVKFRLLGERPTRERFFEMLNTPTKSNNFNDYCDTHLKQVSNGLQPGTIHHHKGALKKLRQYAPDLEIGEITPEWLRAYAKHLRDDLGNVPGTIRKNICVIRMHYYAAMRAGITNANPFETYKAPQAQPRVVFLLEEELKQMVALYQSEQLPDNEQNALRFWLFMAFTGMHITDARNLLIDQIFANEIHYRRVKTHTEVNVPVSAPAAALIKYYKGDRHRGRLFLKLATDQALNRLFKRVAEKANVQKDICAKAARHTFATIYLRKNKGDIATLSKLLGHTSLNTTMVYAHIVKEDRVAGVSVFNDFL